MTRTMKAIKIFEMTENGLQEVFEIETERVDDIERQKEAIENLTEMAFKNDSMFMINEFGSFIIRGLKEKTIVFKIVFEREV
jgi:hypothetical protein